MTTTLSTAADPQPTLFWKAFGWAVHGLFGVMVYFLFFFLRGPDAATAAAPSLVAALVDVALALQFAVLHSLLLLPAVRSRLTRVIPSPAYGVFFCLGTCVSLLITIAYWRPLGGCVWEFSGAGRTVVRGCYYGAWIALFYSVYLSGAGYQTGWMPWRPWTLGRPVPRREFQPRGVYLWFRHPTYLSFLGLIWFVPVMSYDRAVFTAVLSIYIYIGSHLKDRRLLYYLGERYQTYQARVPGYPGLWVGPLARLPWDRSAEAPSAAG